MAHNQVGARTEGDVYQGLFFFGNKLQICYEIFLLALRDVAKAYGIDKVAKRTKLGMMAPIGKRSPIFCNEFEFMKTTKRVKFQVTVFPCTWEASFYYFLKLTPFYGLWKTEMTCYP